MNVAGGPGRAAQEDDLRWLFQHCCWLRPGPHGRDTRGRRSQVSSGVLTINIYITVIFKESMVKFVVFTGTSDGQTP